jgi:hypothetical protein
MLNAVNRPYSQMDWTEEFRICSLLTPSLNISTTPNTSSEQECSFSAVRTGVTLVTVEGVSHGLRQSKCNIHPERLPT